MLKKNVVVPISIAVLLVTLLLIMPGVNARSIGTAAVQDTHPPNAMWIEPSTLNLNVGQKFNITVWVNLKDQSYTWQVTVRFNSTYLKATRVGYTGGTQSQFFMGHTTITVTPIIDNGAGYVADAETLLGNDVRAPGNGSLCWVEFQVALKGTAEEKLDINNVDTYVLNPDLYELPITKYNAVIHWGASATMLYFNISPNPVNSGQNITLKGILVTEFSAPLPGENVQVYARPLTGSWQLLTSVKTNTYGIFMWQATIPQGVTGTFLFAAYYPGSPNYQLTYNFAILTIQ